VDNFLKITTRVFFGLGKKRKHQGAQGLPQSSLLPRDLELRPTPAHFRRETPHQVCGTELDVPVSPAMADIDSQTGHRSDMNTEMPPRLPKPEHKPLDEIATLVQSLTYGEMMELSETIWQSQPEGSPVTQADLPALLHRWAMSRAGTARDDSDE